MKNNFLILAGYFILIAVVLVGSTLFGIHRILDTQQTGHDYQIPVYDGHPYTQQLVSRHNGLNTIYIHLKNVALRNRRSFIFTLSQHNQIIRQIDLNGSNIGDGDNVRFQFAPISASKNQIFTVTLSAPDSQYANAVGVSYSVSQKSFSYQAYYSPQNKIESLVSLVTGVFSRLSPKLIVSWLAFGLSGFFLAKKGIISL